MLENNSQLNPGRAATPVCMLFALLILCLGSVSTNAQTGLSLVQLSTGFDRPVDIASAGDDRLFIAEQEGKVWIINKYGELNPTPFMNVDSIAIKYYNGQGLLGLTFHPNFPTDPRVFIKYTDVDSNVVVSSFSVSAGNPNAVDPTTFQNIITIPQTFRDHNGGDLNFGPDGYLYIATGDGGREPGTGAGDPFNLAQNPMSLLGKILRIDVDGATPYSIPADNPYAGSASALNEIWAVGLRNPWRVSFDRLTGDFWISDVGQDLYEEVNVQPAASIGGENYGWRCYEGALAFDTVSPCADSYTMPDYTYTHDPVSGGFSVTGGYVYRGAANPDLYGKYIFCDYVIGNFWTMEADGMGGYTVNGPEVLVPFVVSFGEDQNGELYACALSGEIYLVQQECSATSKPYNLRSELVSDNVVKLNWNTLNNVDGYQLQGRAVGAGSFASLITAATTRTFGGLPYSTTFEWRARSRCTDGTITDFAPFNYFTTGAEPSPLARSMKPSTFELYPNPVTRGESTTIRVRGSEAAEISLYDINGLLRQQLQLNPGSHTLDLSQLPNGVYLLKDAQGNQSKVVLNR